MADENKLFAKQFDYLVCVDSDGCAMDTMDSKHHTCFGPIALSIWEIADAENNLALWERINLYSATRGINRFKGLLLFFEELAQKGIKIEDLSSLQEWVSNATEHSNRSLGYAIEAHPESECLKKALDWSVQVNLAIGKMPLSEPFPGVAQTLAGIARTADIAVVSSANAEALAEEWERCGLRASVKALLSQNEGSKADCIARLVRAGYISSRVLMVGDAPGDLAAAQENHIHFFPILVKQETQSWERLQAEAIPRFLSGSFDRDYQTLLNTQFTYHLDNH